MARKKTLCHNPSFFKIMHGDFSTKQKLPPAFMKNLNDLENLPLDFTITLRSEVQLSWKVKVERIRGCYYFTRGWSKMVEDLQLVFGDFLIFYLIADDAFQLEVYDLSCCLKKISVSTTSDGSPGSIMHEKVKQKVKKKKKRRPFVKTLAAYNRSFCSLPCWFVSESGLCNEKHVVIKGNMGREWTIKLNYRATHQRYDLNTGWSKFIQENGLATGDTFKLKHIKRCKLKLKVVSQLHN